MGDHRGRRCGASGPRVAAEQLWGIRGHVGQSEHDTGIGGVRSTVRPPYPFTWQVSHAAGSTPVLRVRGDRGQVRAGGSALAGSGVPAWAVVRCGQPVVLAAGGAGRGRLAARDAAAVGRAVWDADAVRDDVRGYVVDALGDQGAVLILDDTGDVKKGACTVGTQRQYTGTAGRIENAQVAVYLAYAAPEGAALIDRAVYLPKAWTGDAARCAAAGVPADVGFATKITLARRTLARALDAGTPAAWCTADEFYGGDRHLRRDLQARGIGYVLAVAKSHRVTARPIDGPVRADRLAATLPSRAWNRLSAGAGSKGERDYDLAWITITTPADEAAGQHSLLIRRRISDGELAFYHCWSRDRVPLHVLVRVAGTR
jgi:SRSO17 transposase